MWDQWNETFRRTLGFAERSLVSELREHRNRWAHQEPFDTRDTLRALDTIDRACRQRSEANAMKEGMPMYGATVFVLDVKPLANLA